MRKENWFYLLIVLTIIIIRISILLVPEVDLMLLKIVIHHIWFGLIILILGLFIPKNKITLKILFYGIGSGLIIDQIVFTLMGSGQDKEYWAWPSLIGTIVLTGLIFPGRQKILNLLFNKK